jgi:hypothetical protein
LEDFKNSLGPLGKWDSFTGQSLRGGMVGRTYISLLRWEYLGLSDEIELLDTV